MASWLFLAVCLVGALLVWNVYRPVGGPRSSAPSFFLGWLTGELGIHHIFWQAVATVGFAWAGALEAWPGQLGLLVAVASWLALGWHYFRGFEARAVVERALDSALPPGYRERILPELDAMVGEGLITLERVEVIAYRAKSEQGT